MISQHFPFEFCEECPNMEVECVDMDVSTLTEKKFDHRLYCTHDKTCQELVKFLKEQHYESE